MTSHTMHQTKFWFTSLQHYFVSALCELKARNLLAEAVPIHAATIPFFQLTHFHDLALHDAFP